MSNVVQDVGEEAMEAYKAALEVLEDWKFDTNLQFPVLLERVAKKLGIVSESEQKELDAQIRYFVRRNPTYKAKRGAGGGIALASAESQREAAKEARAKAKAEAADKVNEQLTAAAATTTAVPTEDVPNEDEADEPQV